MRLAGKVAIVTGGSMGIGRGIVLCMAKEGADVAIADLQVEPAGKVADEVKALGRKAVVVKTDVTKEADIQALFDRVRRDLGRIDILVNNAGVSSKPGLPFTNNTEADWDRVYAVNVKSVFLTCKAIAPHFIERKAGKIINIASIAGPMNSPSMPPYSVSKMGVITFTKIVAKELAPHGINVNAICPGILWTAFWQETAERMAKSGGQFAGMTPRQVFESRVNAIVPMKREQMPEDIGWAAVFLTSEEARNITGQALFVDGGVVM
ncbi:MAG TPA: glucose 1-dehydrogenase [Candidatus Methylomirabilis sp.]|jgi:meso-butanediol dehydrogenase/(S,S)-butanediol dehydrogenase/diacetyl reductase